MIFAASDQTAELEKSNENGDAQDVYVAIEKPDQPVELEEEEENGEVDHLSCRYKYIVCRHLYRYCKRTCYFNYLTCLRLSRGKDVEGSIQDALAAPDQPAELEEESENRDEQHRIHLLVSLQIYLVCVHHYRSCIRACRFHYILCRRGIVEIQDAKESIQPDLAAINPPTAVFRTVNPAGLEEEDENGEVQHLSCRYI